MTRAVRRWCSHPASSACVYPLYYRVRAKHISHLFFNELLLDILQVVDLVPCSSEPLLCHFELLTQRPEDVHLILPSQVPSSQASISNANKLLNHILRMLRK